MTQKPMLRGEMGQTALETTLNELKHVFFLPILFFSVRWYGAAPEPPGGG